MKNKKNLPIFIFVVLILVVVVILAVRSIPGTDYTDALNNTDNLKNYTMGISSIVTLNDGENVRQTTIDQLVKVKNKGKDNMVYSVATTANSYEDGGDVVTEENSYIYKNGNYYHSLPGVNYKSPITKELASENIKSIESIIRVPYEKMKGAEENDGVYTFAIDAADASEHINSMIDFASGQFDNVTFSQDGIEVTATVEGKYITKRSFYLNYQSTQNKSFTIEIYVDLIDTKADIDDVDESRYVSVN